MTVIVTFVFIAFALSVLAYHIGYHFMEKWQAERRIDPDRARVERDIRYAKLL